MMGQTKTAKYPLADGLYPLNASQNYEVKNGIVNIPEGKNARFCLTTPTVPYDANCVNNESWLIKAGSVVLFELDNACGLIWLFRTANNDNEVLGSRIGKEFVLPRDVKNISAIGTSVEGTATIKLYIDGERWI